MLSLSAWARRARIAVAVGIARAAGAVGRWAHDRIRADQAANSATHGLPQVRLAICQACPKFRGTKPLERCSACGCLMRAKVQLAGAKCPEGKW